jgi:transposase InsO family protein
MDLWAWQNGVVMDFSRPGKPTDNAFAEAFNSRIRAELLSAKLVRKPGRRPRQMRGLAERVPRLENPDGASASAPRDTPPEG